MHLVLHRFLKDFIAATSRTVAGPLGLAYICLQPFSYWGSILKVFGLVIRKQTFAVAMMDLLAEAPFLVLGFLSSEQSFSERNHPKLDQ